VGLGEGVAVGKGVLDGEGEIVFSSVGVIEFVGLGVVVAELTAGELHAAPNHTIIRNKENIQNRFTIQPRTAIGLSRSKKFNIPE
jgi:hypothetical protein